MSTLISNGAIPLITKATRILDHSSTIIDHIITNDIKNNIQPGVIESCYLSDHYPIFCQIGKPTPAPSFKKSKDPVNYFRDKSKFNPKDYNLDLNLALSNLFEKTPEINSQTFDTVFNKFIKTIKDIIDIHAPLKSYSRRQKRLKRKPWITKGILVSIRKKNSMFKPYFINGNAAQKHLFKTYTNKLTKIKARSKSLFYKNELSKNKNDPKKVWNIIRTLLPPNKKSPHNINQEIVSKSDIAEKFNDFFCTIGEKLANKISTQNPRNFKCFMKHRISTSIFLEPPNLYEITNNLRNLNVNKAMGHDNLPAYFLKIASNVIAPYLLPIIHFSFSNGIFPEHCKIAKVVPLHKQGSRDDPNNYRPISIPPRIAKIFEKLLHKRLTKFFDKHNVIKPTQYGFQANVSTTHAILDILTSLYDGIREKQFSGLFFLDLKKAFDTVSHNILLSKLDYYGIRGMTLKLMNSYLQRKQYVLINNIESKLQSNNYGAPQGSTLGPLLFLLYINDIGDATHSIPRLFADDACFLLNHSNLATLNTELNLELTEVFKWCSANKLTINPNKCHCMIIPPSTKDFTLDFTLKIDNTIIPSNVTVKYLGVIIDSKLSFAPHSRLKSTLPNDALLKLYYALFQPHLLYGLTIWGSTSPLI